MLLQLAQLVVDLTGTKTVTVVAKTETTTTTTETTTTSETTTTTTTETKQKEEKNPNTGVFIPPVSLAVLTGAAIIFLRKKDKMFDI